MSGSGKSTWAKTQVGYTIVSRDSIRVMLFGTDGPEYYKACSEILREREQEVSIVQDSMIAGLLKNGHDVIIDNTNIEWKFVKALAKIGYRYGAEVEVKVFDVPLRTAIANDKGRAAYGGRAVGEAVITRQHSRFQGNKDKTLEPVFAPKPYAGTPGKPKAFLVDIDGTLAHMKGRSPFEWKRVGEDTLDEVIADIVSSLFWAEDGPKAWKVIVMSGRDAVCRQETIDWLNSHNIPFDALFMRPANDMRPDNLIKAELFDTYVRDNYDVQFVLDDRDQVVDMWRAMGLTCLQVAPGDF